MARRTLDNNTKQGILDGLRNGENKAVLAAKFSVSVPTIYNYAKTLLTTVSAPITEESVGIATATVEAPVATRKATKRSTR